MLKSHAGLDKIAFDFLSQKEYNGKLEPISKKVRIFEWKIHAETAL